MDDLFDWIPSLRESSLNRLTNNYWKQPAMRKKILDFFTQEYFELSSETQITELLKELLSWTKELLDQVRNTPNISFFTKDLLIKTIKPTGERLINFLARVTLDLQTKKNPSAYPSFKNYIDNIYWTNYGTIDEVKIFKVIYNSKPADNIEIDMVYLYQQACKNYIKDYTELIWKILLPSQRKLIYKKYSCCSSNFRNIISSVFSLSFFFGNNRNETEIRERGSGPPNDYWQWYHHCQSVGDSERCNSIVIHNTMIQEIRRANYLGVKYMFYLLEKNGEDLRQKEAMEVAAKEQGKNVSSLQDLFGIKSMDIVMLLRKKIKEPIFLIDAEILSLISVSWPWKYEFFDIFQSNPSYHDLVKDIIEFIAPKIVEEMALYGIIKHTSCWIIKGILKIIPNDLEKNYIKLFHFLMDDVIGKNTDIIEALYILLQSDDDDYNDDNGECVFNGEQQAFRLHLKKFYTHLLIREKYEIIEFFMEKSMPHEGLKIHFKEQWNDAPLVYQYFMYHQKHNAAEKFLDWQFEAEYEKNYYKRTYNCENSKNFFD